MWLLFGVWVITFTSRTSFKYSVPYLVDFIESDLVLCATGILVLVSISTVDRQGAPVEESKYNIIGKIFVGVLVLALIALMLLTIARI